MIVQNVSSQGRTDITFTLPVSDAATALAALSAAQADIGFSSTLFDEEVAKVSLVGAGMRSNPGVSATFFRALAEADVNVEMISTSEIRVSDASKAVTALHTAFGLDADGEAVIYAGTGR